MRRLVALAAAALVVVACSNGGNDAESIRKQIAELRKQSITIDNEILQLEKELEKVGGEKSETGLIPIQVKQVVPEQFSRYIEYSAKVEAIEDAKISTEASGIIKDIYVVRGQQVRKGQPIAKVSSETVETSISEIETQIELARDVYEKQKALWAQKIGSEIQYLTAKNNLESLQRRKATAKAQLAMSTLRAPFNGVIDDIMMKEGELVTPGASIAHIVNPSQLRITADVSETYSNTIRKGAKVEVNFPSVPGLSLTLPVNRTGNVVDPQSRTFTVEMLASNPKNAILPNQIANLRLKMEQNNEAFVVPSIIVKQDNKGSFLFTAEQTSKGLIAKKTYVTVGASYQDNSTIASGIKAGDKVIVSGFAQVSNGSPVVIR